MTDPVSTTIRINGVDYDLKHMSKEKGAELYAALGTTGTATNYQQMADAMADLALHFQSIISIPGPKDLSPTAKINALVKALKDGGGKVGDNADTWIKEFMGTDAGKALKGALDVTGVSETTDNLKLFMEGASAFTRNFAKPFMMPFTVPGKTIDAIKGTGLEVWNMMDGEVDPAQAKAYGAAYAAAMYAEMDAPDAPAANKKPEAGWLDGIQARLQGGFDWIWRGSIGTYLSAFTSAIGKKFFGKESGKDWSECWNEALAEAEKERSEKPDLTYEERLDKILLNKVEKGARSEASKILMGAEEVAGISTEPLAKVIDDGGVYRAHDGTLNSLSFEKGTPKHEELKDKDGNTLTTGKTVVDKWKGLTDEALPDGGKAGLVGYGAGVVAAGASVKPVVKLATKFPTQAKFTAKAARKMTRGLDIVEGAYDFATGDAHGVAENSGQLAGSYAGQKAAIVTAEKTILKFVPKKYQIAATGLIGLFGFFGGRELLGEAAGAIVPEAKAETPQNTDASQQETDKKISTISSLSTGAELGFNASVVGTGIISSLTKLGPLASGASKAAAFIPGPIRTGMLAIGDGYTGVTAAMHGDKKAAAHSTGRVAGGVLTAIAASAGTGALVGSVFPGVGNLACGIAGGIMGAVGYYFGSDAGGKAADALTGYDENKNTTTVASTTPKKPSVEADPAIAAAVQERYRSAEYQNMLAAQEQKLKALAKGEALRSGQGLAVNVKRVQAGSVINPPPAPAGKPSSHTNAYEHSA